MRASTVRSVPESCGCIASCVRLSRTLAATRLAVRGLRVGLRQRRHQRQGAGQQALICGSRYSSMVSLAYKDGSFVLTGLRADSGAAQVSICE